MSDGEHLDPDEEALRVYHWRVRVFMAEGFTLRQAKVLARLEVDSHAPVALLAAGCPADVAFDILS